MTEFVVYLTNPSDQRGGASYTSGKYGFCVEASDLAAAMSGAVERARLDGFYGHDWSAKIVGAGCHGQLAGPEAIIALRDNLADPAFAVYTTGVFRKGCAALPSGGVRLW